MAHITAPYSPLPQQQSMAPTHQSLGTPQEKRFSVPRKPVSSQIWDSQQTLHVSEDEVDHLTDNTCIRQDTSQQRQSGKDSLSRVWLVELASLTLAYIAFGAIIITLWMHQDLPLPKWPSLISINTLVAVFTAILKASMMLPIAEGVSQIKWLWFRQARPLIDLETFDSASRGPWGCILLLCKRTTTLLTVLGALVTIVAMAVDPFTQQVIQYDYCSTVAPKAVGQIPRTNNYTAGSRANNGGAGFLSGAMNAAFYTGLYDPPKNASSNIGINCQTGNCTFPATETGVSYMSLGMCSSCNEISDQITNRTTVDKSGKTILEYVLPSNLTISPLGRDSVAGSMVVTQPEQAGGPPMIAQSIVDFDMMVFDTTVCKDIATFTDCRVWASRCSLTPCVKSYAANVSNGILEERVLSTTPLQYLSAAEGYAYFGIFTPEAVVDGQNQSCEPTSAPTARNTLRMSEGITWINEEYLHNVSSAQYYPPECAFTLGSAATDGLFGTLFSTYNNQTIESIVEEYDGNPWMLQLFDSGAATPQSLNTAIAGLASAITAAFRNGGSAINSAPAVGAVLVSQTCIRVRWAWLVLPGALLLLSTLFLLCTIWETSMDHMGKAWKSSPLALLFHGFSSETVRSVGKVDRLSKMNAAAKKMQAQLRWEEHGWRFSEVASEKGDSFDSESAAAMAAEEELSRPGSEMSFPPPPGQGGRNR